MDTVDQSTRSRIMSMVGQKNTGPEIRLRKALHAEGLRFRLHDKRLPGSPDLVFPKYKTAVFVHGCFWHRHGCSASTDPSSRKEFWNSKFAANLERDKNNRDKLLRMGWRVLIVWECTLKETHSSITAITSTIKAWLLSGGDYLEL